MPRLEKEIGVETFDGKSKLVVKSHPDDKNRVLVEIDGETREVNAGDLKRAVEDATKV